MTLFPWCMLPFSVTVHKRSPKSRPLNVLWMKRPPKGIIRRNLPLFWSLLLNCQSPPTLAHPKSCARVNSMPCRLAMGNGPHIPPITSQNPEPSFSTPSNPSLSSKTPVAGPSTGGPIPGPRQVLWYSRWWPRPSHGSCQLQHLNIHSFLFYLRHSFAVQIPFQATTLFFIPLRFSSLSVHESWRANVAMRHLVILFLEIPYLLSDLVHMEVQHLAIGHMMFFIVTVRSHEMLQQVVKAKVE